MMELVSWDDDIPNMMGKLKAMFQTTNQYIFSMPVFASLAYRKILTGIVENDWGWDNHSNYHDVQQFMTLTSVSQQSLYKNYE
jgi:hypothetical protein